MEHGAFLRINCIRRGSRTGRRKLRCIWHPEPKLDPFSGDCIGQGNSQGVVGLGDYSSAEESPGVYYGSALANKPAIFISFFVYINFRQLALTEHPREQVVEQLEELNLRSLGINRLED